MAVKVLTSVAQLQWDRVPAVVAKHASRQNAAIHTNKTYDDEKRRRDVSQEKEKVFT